MEIQKIPIKKIKHAKYNPRKNLKPGDAEYEKLKRSITEFGYVEPVIWNQRTGNIVGGHQRFKVLTQLGEKEVDCVVVDMDDEKEKALNVALNKVSGDWDMPLLTDLLKDLDDSGFDLSLTGFDMAEINELFGEPDALEDDFDPDQALDEITSPMTQPGDVWLLGKHRLICGDSTIKDDMDILMDGQLADLVLTDPPYNVDYQGGTKEKLKIQNDKLGDAAFLEFLTAAFTRMFEQSKKGAPIYVFHADSEGYNFRTAFKEAGYVLRQCLVWVKNSLVMGRQDYQWQHEPVLYGWKAGAGHAWYGDRKQTTLIRFDKPLRNGEHPTMKPVGLCGYFIGNSSKEGDIVLDSFGGSGSTLIACEQMGRVCYTSELDPKYCDVIVKRYAETTGTEDGISVVRNGATIPYSDLLKDE
ncbi:site-specific DNA-methyltransferase [Acetobacterium wieringae]|uniref:Modification methylase DpnIIB n=1 Tax=Acetobacterium wieringae TaxID=52694 RepID=A0A1F2PEU5_9FIRM|nr:site-specific DNA-methyltransferase [Acetobacterium wieringae]OFV69196.1 modification methylase DpnIIB [Acetobacterium wieringae]